MKYLEYKLLYSVVCEFYFIAFRKYLIVGKKLFRLFQFIFSESLSKEWQQSFS